MPAGHGRVALVTGSSRGLGAVIAGRLARDGLAVAVNGRRGDKQAGKVGQLRYWYSTPPAHSPRPRSPRWHGPTTWTS
jgi:NAD(P)-dependent dehydrogenase (short-subunit alcohol dehydrogenase family)